jgi:YaiO family outer membrane protein
MMHGVLIVLIGAARLLLAQDNIAQDNIAPDPEALQSQARTAVSEKRFSDALAVYRTLARNNPQDVDYILWIARLSAWTGDRAGAADFYSRALALDPNNVDGMVGKANVLMWQHSYQDAFVLLTAAGKIAPLNIDLELAWSRYYHWQGDDKQAKDHLENCLAVDSENQEALELKESLVPDHTIELRMAYEGDTLPGTTPGAIEEIGATYFYPKGDIGLDFFHLNRFGEAGSRGGLHLSRRFGATSLRVAGLVGGGGAIVPKLDLSAGISRKVTHGLVLGADYRHLAFQALTVNSAIANLEYYFEKPIWIVTSCAANGAAGAFTPAYLARFYSRVRKNLTLNAGYAYGSEVFQLALPTDFGNFKRDSYIGGAGLTLTRKTRAEATYTLARRSTGVFENMFLLALVHTL